LTILPQLGDEVEEVGAEAFVEDAPILEDIERSFSKDKPRQSAAPKPSPSTKPEPTAPSARPEGDPRPVLARQRWSKPRHSHEKAGDDKSVEAKPVKKSLKETVVKAQTRPRYTIDLSPKSRQILRWSAMALPIVLIGCVTLYLFGGRTGRRARPRVSENAAVVDPAALEAQASALYNAAIENYRAGKTEESIAILQQLAALFPLTNAGAQARQALDRIGRGLSPFGDEPAVPQVAVAPGGSAGSDGADGSGASNRSDKSDGSVRSGESQAVDAARKKAFVGIRRAPAGEDAGSPAGSEPSIDAAAKLPGAPPQGSTLAKSDASARALPEGFVAVSESGVDGSGWPIEIICLKDQSHMMLVPAGEFAMGNPNGEPNARSVHRVRLKAFYIDRYEITLAQYKHFLQQRKLSGSPYRELSAAALSAVPTDRHPVVGVAWRDGNAYAEWSGKTLPTEAEWEKAARGIDGRVVPWGSGAPRWEKPRQHKHVDRVGSFSWDVSVYGCFDMSGNAWEWCSDWYDPNSYNRVLAEDPEGPKSALPPVSSRDPEKVIRGGSPDWEVTWRGFLGFQEEQMHVGFRCVLQVEKLSPRTPTASVVTESPRQLQPQAPSRIPPGGFKF
jgi:formylglycine-generating enzyme required for sulfatase activity